VAYVDVDDFKQINDTHGHAAGDRVLRWLADRLRVLVNDVGVVARLGGDEFGILLRSTTASQAHAWQTHGLAALLGSDTPYGVTVSAGICLVPPNAATVEEVLHLADSQMYEAKRQRKLGGPPKP
jgi:diguanylate cyclase (GGDEF)-like protein